MTRPHRRRTLAALLRARRGDDGFAMLTVIISMFILTLLATVALEFALKGVTTARRGQDASSAQDAERAGAQDLLHHLQEVDDYWSGSYNASYSGCSATVDATLPHTCDPSNLALGGFVTLANTATDKAYGDGLQYSYSFIRTDPSSNYNDEISLDGQVLAKVVGKSRTSTVTDYLRFQKTNFLENAYITDFETVDPNLYPEIRGTIATDTTTPIDAQNATTECAHHFVEVSPTVARSTASFDPAHLAYASAAAGCSDPRFTTTDTINGPVYTNDALLIYGTPTFKQGYTVKTGYATSPYYRAVDAASKPAALPNAQPQSAGKIALPHANTKLAKLADYAQNGKGCYYAGPTQITFNAAGTMTVYSPYTTSLVSTHVNPLCYTGSLPSTYPAAATAVTTSNKAWTVNIPKNGIIYVDDPGTLGGSEPTCPTVQNPFDPNDTTNTITLNGLINLHDPGASGNPTRSYPVVVPSTSTSPAPGFDVGGAGPVKLPSTLAVNYRGPFDTTLATAYNVNDVVTYLSKTWIATGPQGTGEVPGVSANWSQITKDFSTGIPVTTRASGTTPLIYTGATGSNDVTATNGLFTNAPADFTLNPTNGYTCQTGDLFVEGTLKGRVTMGAERDVIVTKALTYSNASTDILGLVASNNIRIYNPVECTQYGYSLNSAAGANQDLNFSKKVAAGTVPICLTGSSLTNGNSTGLTVKAALIAGNGSAGSVYADNYWITQAQHGTFTLLGAIVQEYRGPMSTSNTAGTLVSGFAKSYSYDARMAYAPPPSLADPDDSIPRPWQIGTDSQQKPGS